MEGAGGRGGGGGRAGGTEEELVSLIGQFCQFLSTPAKRVICIIHDNQHYPENALRARFRGIQVMSSSSTCFERLTYYTFKVFWGI